MRTQNFVRMLVPLACIVVLGAHLTSAQTPTFKGRFTLQQEVGWGTARLPAGDYSFTLDYQTAGVAMVHVRSGEKTVANIIAATSGGAAPEADALVLSRGNEHYIVRALQLRDPGLILTYTLPVSRERSLAKNELSTVVPVVAGKR